MIDSTQLIFGRGSTVGGFSIWHWLIMLILLGVPIIFIVRRPPAGPNRFGELPESMSFGEAVTSFFRNYVNFSTRASRSEFWFCVLFYVGGLFTLSLFDFTGFFSLAFSLGTLIPLMALYTRRLHDINRSGWHQLLSCFFPIGPIALLVWYCSQASDQDQGASRASSKPTRMSSVELLEKFARLKDSGAITAGEYEAEKRKILNQA